MSIRNLLENNADRIKDFLDRIGYDSRHWIRSVMYDHCLELLRNLDCQNMDTLEISAGPYFKRKLQFKSFTEANYPEFDICNDVLDRKFDLIIADQVFEHLLWPYRAAKNVHSMLKPGGYFLITTPFLVRVHDIPYDCTRWTETGIKYFLCEAAGFPLDSIQTFSWGNKACVVANFKKWVRRGWFRSLKNDPNLPVVVWALARKIPGEDAAENTDPEQDQGNSFRQSEERKA